MGEPKKRKRAIRRKYVVESDFQDFLFEKAEKSIRGQTLALREMILGYISNEASFTEVWSLLSSVLEEGEIYAYGKELYELLRMDVEVFDEIGSMMQKRLGLEDVGFNVFHEGLRQKKKELNKKESKLLVQVQLLEEMMGKWIGRYGEFRTCRDAIVYLMDQRSRYYVARNLGKELEEELALGDSFKDLAFVKRLGLALKYLPVEFSMVNGDELLDFSDVFRKNG